MAGLIGQRLGQYEITALVGKGGMATVYRARQASINRDVAIKVIRPDLVDTGDFMARFQREAQAVASLSHPFILKVFDYGNQDDLVYLVMELLRGGSLADLMNSNPGPLPVDVISRVVEQLASALDYAHGLGIIHRDLKPQNVLLDEQGNAHLTDFGIAKILSETTVLTQTGIAMGTPAYMSPEQWMGQPLDARTDVYAFGAMLFEMLTGRLPFSAETSASLMYKHLQQPPPSIRDVQTGLPRSIDAVITKALAKDREQRYASAGTLASAFRTALTGQLPIPFPSPQVSTTPGATMVETPPPGIASQPISVPQTSPRRVPGVLIGAIVLILAAVLIGGYVVLSGRGGQPTTVPTTALAALPTSTVIPATTPAGAAAIASATGTAGPTLPSNAPSATLPPPSTDARTFAVETVVAGMTQTGPAKPSQAVVDLADTQAATSIAGPTTVPSATPQPTATNMPVLPTVPPSVTPLPPTVPPSMTPPPAATNMPVPPTVPTLVPTAVYTLPPPATLPPAATSTPVPPTVPALTPTTEITLKGRVVFASNRNGKYQLFIVDAANPEAPRPVLSSNADDFGPGVSSDGAQIAFTSNRQGGNQLYVVGTDGSNAHRLVSVPGDNYAPAWSPDGTRIVFHNNRSGNWQLYMVRADGSNLRRLTNDSADNTDASWAPDGIHIAFHSKPRNGSSGIYTMDVNGSTPTRLSPPNLDANDPVWSPDGQYVVFTVFKNKQPNLYRMDADGANVQPLLAQPGSDDQAAWSPDSHFIVFRSRRSGQTGIYVVDVNGQNLQQLTSTPTDNHFPAWFGS